MSLSIDTIFDESEMDVVKAIDERRKEMDNNNVDHPSHYNREGAKECIEEMEMIFGRRAVCTFCLLNAWKYRYRAADKNGKEDLKKSDWYLAKYEELGGDKYRDPWSGVPV